MFLLGFSAQFIPYLLIAFATFVFYINENTTAATDSQQSDAIVSSVVDDIQKIEPISNSIADYLSDFSPIQAVYATFESLEEIHHFRLYQVSNFKNYLTRYVALRAPPVQALSLS